MYLTEAEATQQECPFFRDTIPATGYQGVGVGGPYPEREVHRYCRGSACKIGWRWRERVVYTDPAMKDPPAGYCGGMGKPER